MSRIQTVRDELGMTLQGMTDALAHRMAPTLQLTENGQRFRSMTLMEMAREVLAINGVSTRGMDRMQLAAAALTYRSGAGMGTVSDFPSLLSNVANKRLRSTYTEHPGTYKTWARRAEDAKDFRSINAVQLGAMPDLLQVKEHGEFKYGQIKDGVETYALLTYGRMVSLTRQALINDDLRAFDVAVASYGAAAARLENRTAYAQLISNAALNDGIALFHGDHHNLATGAGSQLALASLAAGRTAMRKQKGLQEEELNITPSFLIVPTALEQDAYKLTSASYVPALPNDVNEFRAGGRSALTPVVEPVLDNTSSTAWYLASSNSQVDTVEYCYLAGTDGPVIESQVGFSVDGMTLKCRLDFAAKAIDYRGLYKATGV